MMVVGKHGENMCLKRMKYKRHTVYKVTLVTTFGLQWYPLNFHARYDDMFLPYPSCAFLVSLALTCSLFKVRWNLPFANSTRGYVVENMVKMVMLVIMELDLFTFTKKMGFCRTLNLGLWSTSSQCGSWWYYKNWLLPFSNDCWRILAIYHVLCLVHNLVQCLNLQPTTEKKPWTIGPRVQCVHI